MKFSDIENLKTEGSSGVEDLARLCETLGYVGQQLTLSNGSSVTSITEFLQDNPGAVEAVYDWIRDNADCWDACFEEEEEEEFDDEEL